ncbi:MAG: Type II secretory pathway, pullulanase PulA and related glycosidase [Eubacterium sp.]|nr:Type II secretory pathway, pullulanase PulA and related glycosidase [Eubacterium sp.]
MKQVSFPVKPASPTIPGVSFCGKNTVFVFPVPEGAIEAELLLYQDEEEDPVCVIPLPESERYGSVSAVAVTLPKDSVFTYLYRIDGCLLTDPSARVLRLCRAGGKEYLRGVVREPVQAETKPLPTPFEDCAFYKLHVRGFSRNKPGAGKKAGTFAALQDALPYLKDLGINALLLMPVYEFNDVPRTPACRADRPSPEEMEEKRTNYWGYTDGFYFSPRLSYSASGEPDREFAALVDSIHRAGMLCIPEFYFAENENPRLAADVLRHWLFTWHVDGFHLVGGGAWVQAVLKDPVLSKTRILVGREPESASKTVSGPVQKRIAVYNKDYEHSLRRFLKGDLDLSMEEIAWMQRRNAPAFSYMSFLADQDGFTLADAVSYEERHNEANGEENRDGTSANFTWNCGEEGASRKSAVSRLRLQQLRNAFLLQMTAQGVPVIYAGDEVMNSQRGNNNAWCQDNETGWVSWNRTKAAASLQQFVKEALAFRKKHPVLHGARPHRLVDYKNCGLPDVSYHSRQAWIQQSTQMKAAFGTLYSGAYAVREDGEADDTLMILYNMYWQEQSFALPDLPAALRWYRKADTSADKAFFEDGMEPVLPETEKTLSVPARSIVILIAK